MDKNLTDYEKKVIEEFEYYENEAKVAFRKAESLRRVMLKVLGHKADCSLCRNRHWPLCNKEG